MFQIISLYYKTYCVWANSMRGKVVCKCRSAKITLYTVMRNLNTVQAFYWFSMQVLDIIAPPYTPEFGQLFLPLIECKDITDSIRSDDGSDPVSEFICKNVIYTVYMYQDYYIPVHSSHIHIPLHSIHFRWGVYHRIINIKLEKFLTLNV